MTMDPTKFAKLIALKKMGNLAVCEYLRVEWNNGANTAYYGTDAYSRITPFRRVKKYTGGAHIDAKVLGGGFQQFEISGDIRTDQVPLKFEDADGAIKALFKLYGAARVELFRYYPQIDANESIWWGQILAPQRQGKMTFAAMMKNGYRSKERFLPNRPMPSECPFTFGGLLDTADKIACNGCPYDKHLGGSNGLYKTGTTPFEDCPKGRGDCTARFGHDHFFGGVDIAALPTQTGSSRDPLSQTTGNRTIRNRPIPWGFGTKYYGGAPVLLWGQEFNAKHPTEGFVRGLWPVVEGPILSMNDLEVAGVVIGAEHLNVRAGTIGQPPTSYPGTTQRLSSTALVFARRGPVDPNNFSQADMTLRVLMQLYALVAVYSDDTTFSRIWSDDVIWCLLEMYSNQKCGLGYEHSRFNIPKWRAESSKALQSVTMTLTKADGETLVFAGRRATLDAVLEGRSADQQILDICRAARVSPPFQEDGQYSIKVFKQFASDELDAAPVFRDYEYHGDKPNVVFTGPESVVFGSIPDDQLPNELTVTFEEATNFDIGRPIVVNDPDQQKKAAQVAGNIARNVVPKQLSAVGVRNLHQAGRFAYHNLYFGDFESGGTMNNATAPIIVPFEWVHAVERYGPVKLDLQHAEVPINPTTGLPFVWFRITGIKALDSNNAQISVAAYNKEFYESIETAPEAPTVCSIDDECGPDERCVDGVCVPVGGGGDLCTDDSDCGDGFYCDIHTHRCLPIHVGPGCDPAVTMTQDPVRGILRADIADC